MSKVTEITSGLHVWFTIDWKRCHWTAAAPHSWVINPTSACMHTASPYGRARSHQWTCYHCELLADPWELTNI